MRNGQWSCLRRRFENCRDQKQLASFAMPFGCGLVDAVNTAGGRLPRTVGRAVRCTRKYRDPAKEKFLWPTVALSAKNVTGKTKERMETEDCILANRQHLIYLATCELNGKYYVGKTCQGLMARWKQHIGDLKHSQSIFHRAMRKYSPDNFTLHILAEANSLEAANNLERLWIVSLRSFEPSTGYNSTFGGDGVRPTPESIERLSRALKGKFVGSKHHHFGKHPSAETRLKISIGRTGVCVAKRPDLRNDELLRLYESGIGIRQLAKQFGADKAAITYRLKKVGFVRRPHSEATTRGMVATGYKRIDIPVQEVVALYNSGMKGERIGHLYGIDKSRIYDFLEEAGVARRSPNQSRYFKGASIERNS